MKYCEKGGQKRSGGGPLDLSGAGSREWVSSLKDPSSTRKECPTPMNVCDLKIRIDRCECIEFQRGGTQNARKDRRLSYLTNHESTWHHGSA